MPNLNLMFGKTEAVGMITILSASLFIVTPIYYYIFFKTKQRLHFLNPSQSMLQKIMLAQTIVFGSAWVLMCVSQGQKGTQTTQFVAYFMIYIQANFTALMLLNALGKRDLCLPGG